MQLTKRSFLGFALGAAVAVALAADVFAAGPRELFPIDLEALRAKEAAAFEAADANGDGAVSADEFAASDGPRSRQEHAGKRRGRSAIAFDSRNFELGDTDGDGALSREEFEALPQARRAARAQRTFERLDANGDGVLSAGEFPSRADRLAALDADGDGMLTREEMRQGRRR